MGFIDTRAGGEQLAMGGTRYLQTASSKKPILGS